MARRSRSAPMPRWSEKRGWQGGEKNRVYAFTNNDTGRTFYRAQNGKGAFGDINAGPPHCSVRRARAEEIENETWENGIDGKRHPMWPRLNMPNGWKAD